MVWFGNFNNVHIFNEILSFLEKLNGAFNKTNSQCSLLFELVYKYLNQAWWWVYLLHPYKIKQKHFWNCHHVIWKCSNVFE